MIKVMRLTFVTEKRFKKRDAEKLRGFFGNLYKEEDLFHNHKADGNSIFRMPLIQYKIIDGQLTIFGYNEAVPIITDKFLKVNEIIIDKEKITNFETSLSVNDEKFEIEDNLHAYNFESLWLAVNQKNYLQYINQKLDLNKVLQNNILTNFKGLGIQADKRIMAKGEFKEKAVKINNIEYFGFTGNFVSNVKMPDYMSVGKNRAIGFGCVRWME